MSARFSNPALPHCPTAMLVEGIVTTLNADGTPHIAPMGPIVDADFNRLLLRPFRTSVTYQNLKRTGQGVLHVTDDVELFARAAVGRLEKLPPLRPAEAVDGVILADACRWYAFRVESLDDRAERTQIVARVVDRGRQRDFFGFNRAKHAVVEAAILATRIGLLDADHIRGEFARLSVLVEKTGGQQEQRAFRVFAKLRGRATGRPPPNARGVARPMTRHVQVRAPCRLHFGIFGFGRSSGPQWGGVGVMVEPPAVNVTIEPAAEFTRQRFARRTCPSNSPRPPPVSGDFPNCPPAISTSIRPANTPDWASARSSACRLPPDCDAFWNFPN